MDNSGSQLRIAILILAGGQSSRMGQDKALVLWEGVPMLRRVCDVALQCGCPVYLLSPWSDRYQTILPPQIQLLNELTPGQGPLIALHQGLTQIQSDWILLLACDLPCLQATILKDWIHQLATLPPQVLALVPKQDHYWEPLCAFYHRDAQTNLQAFMGGGDRSFQTWLTQIPLQELPISEQTAATLRNCNTPQDLLSIDSKKRDY